MLLRSTWYCLRITLSTLSPEWSLTNALMVVFTDSGSLALRSIPDMLNYLKMLIAISTSLSEIIRFLFSRIDSIWGTIYIKLTANGGFPPYSL